MPRWQPVYVGIGSNLDNPVRQVERAIADLANIPDTSTVTVSKLVRSKPLGNDAQPDYINAVAALITRLAPERLLDELQQIESRRGRTRSGRRWEPRTLDLDILVFGSLQLATERLTVPHPQLQVRSFVLGPLSELAPDLQIIGCGTAGTLAAQIDLSDLQLVVPAKDRKNIGTD